MLRPLTTIILLLAFLNTTAQSALEKANTCFEKKEYQCAVDNYLIALEQKNYKEDDKYIVEYRIARGYDELKQDMKALDFYQRSLVSKPGRAAVYWDIADVYYDRLDYTNALLNYKLARDKTVEKADLQDQTWWIGNCYVALKNQRMIVTELLNVESRSGAYIKIDGFVADALFALKKFDSALIYYKKYEASLGTDEKVKMVKCYQGKCYRELGKKEEAMQQQDAVLQMDANHAEARWEKGILYAGRKEYALAIEQYKKAIANVGNDSVKIFTLSGNISVCNQYIGNFAEAVSWQQKRKAVSTNKYAEYARIAALQYGKLKSPKEAEKTCAEAILGYPLENTVLQAKAKYDLVKLNAIAGKIAMDKKDTIKAQKYFEDALKLDNYTFEANAAMGEIYWNRKEVEKYKKYYANITKSSYDTLLSSSKDIATVYARAGYIDAYYNKVSASSYKYNVESALGFDSLQKEALLLWPRVLLADNYTLNAKRPKCISVLNRAIKTYAAENELVSNLYNCKAVLTESTDTASIRAALETAVKICPENIDPWDNLLKFYGSYNNAKGAVMSDKLIEVLKKKKDNVSLAAALVYKGDFLWRLDKKDEAKKVWQEALVWDANNTTAKERAKM